MAAVIAAELCRPLEQACAPGPPDLVAYAQEVVILTLAFSLGWYILRPVMRMMKYRAVPTETSSLGLRAELCWESRKMGNPNVGSTSEDVKQTQLDSTTCDDHEDSQLLHRQRAEVQLAREHAKSRRPDLAVGLWMQAAAAISRLPAADQQGSMPRLELYIVALEACVKCKDFACAYRLASSAGWPTLAGSVSGQAALLALARWLARRQELANANKCLEVVRRSGGHADIRTLCALCVATARGGELEVATDFFSMISTAKGVGPSLRVFSAMVRGFSSKGDAKQAAVYLWRMVAQGLRPDAMLFDTVLEACANQNLFSLTMEVLQTMESLCVHASNATLASLVKLYATRGELLKAYAAFQDMPKKHKFRPNAHVYGLLISACIVHDRVDLALDIYARMIGAGCFPGARTYESLVKASLKRGEYEKAIALVDEALCLQRPQQDEGGALQQEPRVPAILDVKVIEELLMMLGRRRLARSLALPLLQRLEAANFVVPESLVEAMLREANAEETSLAPERKQRRARLDQWRSFE